MRRAEVLRELVAQGRSHSPERIHELAADLGLLAADLFVIAGRPVPAHLLPPARDAEVLREFTYRVTFCGHAQLASLQEFVLSQASAGPGPAPEVPHDARSAPSGTDRFADILDGFLRNRGLGIRELPFAGLSVSTIRGMLGGRFHNLQQLKAMAGPLGWTLEDLAAVAGEPLGGFGDCSTLCHHVGRVYLAAIPLTTAQLVRAAAEADRLSGREDRGAWRPAAQQVDDCPDGGGPGRGA
ncbi:hypothetical protein [Streptomyces sp. NPDC096132]|uniref:hypothetical protein n=1 Tax=Streptomyces sp. NPDC096132 TaxID=3366075 RepID=UPI00382B08D9